MDDMDNSSKNLTVEEIQRMIQEAFAHDVQETRHMLNRRQSVILREERSIRRGFERRLAQRYGQALDLFEMFLIACRDLGMEFNRKHQDRTAQEHDYAFEALARLHARACLVASEIRSLLASGHPSGAHARWRTLHELAVIAYFIKAHGAEVAERYMLHERVITAREAEKYVKHAPRLNHRPYPLAELEQLRRTKRDLIERFGQSFTTDYGWAAEILVGTPNFARIEESIGMDHWRPYVGMASHSVHGGFKGMAFDIGHYGYGAGEVMLVGPSDAGLIEAGDGTLIDMNNCTVALLSYRATPESAIAVTVLNSFIAECRDAFYRAHQQLEADEEARRLSTDTGGRS